MFNTNNFNHNLILLSALTTAKVTFEIGANWMCSFYKKQMSSFIYLSPLNFYR